MKWNELVEFSKEPIPKCVKVKDTYFTIHSFDDDFCPCVYITFSHNVSGKNDSGVKRVYETQNIYSNYLIEDVEECSNFEFVATKFESLEPKSLEELIKKFQKDLNKFKNNGDVGYYLKVPFEGPIEMEVKRVI